MVSPIPGRSAPWAHGRAAQARTLELLASTLRRAVTHVDSSPTLQEGLYRAYTRDLASLADVDGVPDDLRRSIDAIVGTLGEAFGFDSTGAKTRPSSLDTTDAAAVFALLRVVSATAAQLAARHE